MLYRYLLIKLNNCTDFRVIFMIRQIINSAVANTKLSHSTFCYIENNIYVRTANKIPRHNKAGSLNSRSDFVDITNIICYNDKHSKIRKGA